MNTPLNTRLASLSIATLMTLLMLVSINSLATGHVDAHALAAAAAPSTASAAPV